MSHNLTRERFKLDNEKIKIKKTKLSYSKKDEMYVAPDRYSTSLTQLEERLHMPSPFPMQFLDTEISLKMRTWERLTEELEGSLKKQCSKILWSSRMIQGIKESHLQEEAIQQVQRL